MSGEALSTKERLARALDQIRLTTLAARARMAEFSDYETAHVTPKMLLVEELSRIGTEEALAFAERIKAGEFDDTDAEGVAWFEREGHRLLQEGR